jgi:hypothetical protein
MKIVEQDSHILRCSPSTIALMGEKKNEINREFGKLQVYSLILTICNLG